MTSMLPISIWKKNCKKDFIKNYMYVIIKYHYKIYEVV